MKCPKCGFGNLEEGAATCPKCGVVFAKLRRVREEEAAFRTRLAAERSLSSELARQLAEDEELRSRLSFDVDREYERDEAAYPVTRLLAGLFAFLALFTAVTEIMGLIQFYQWVKPNLEPRELFLSMISLGVAVATSVGMLLAISEGLRMGRDVANGTRAMRAYLRRMTGK